MNSQNNNENSNNTDTADKETKHYDNIYSNSNKQPSQTGESTASNDEKGNVQYADRSIRDDINDYKFVKSYKSHGHHKHHHHHHSSKELNALRIKDIQTIQEYYKQNHTEIGHRNQLCFAFYIHAKLLYCNIDKAWVALWQFNDNFTCPLSEKKLQNCICTAIHKNYYMKTSTLMDKLGISKELGERLNLQCIQPKTKNNAAYCKKYYAKKKLNAKQKQLEKEKKTIIALKKKYKTNKTIAHILHISEKKVERLVSSLIKERKLWSAKILKQFQIIRDYQKWSYLFDKERFVIQQEEEGFDELYPIIRKERSD